MKHTVSSWRPAIGAALAIVVANLVVLSLGRLLGADMVVASSAGEPPVRVGVGPVVLMSVGPALLGGVVLRFVRRRGVLAWRVVGWLGLALGLASTAMPLSVVATSATTATLALMHVVAGLTWFTAMHRAVTREAPPTPVLEKA